MADTGAQIAFFNVIKDFVHNDRARLFARFIVIFIIYVGFAFLTVFFSKDIVLN